MTILDIQGIKKTFTRGKKIDKALQGISLTLHKGERFGLIGPDGAGKTTLFRILTTLLLPNAGTAFISGYDVIKDYRQIRKRIGYMPGKFSLYPDLSIEENLSFFATLFNTSVAKNKDIIEDIYVHLEPFKHRQAKALSGGMKQKLALCCSLIHRPEILFLDEPTTGVDAVSRKEFWDLLEQLRKHQITFFVSTPYMDEASRCDRVALIQEGEILQVNTPDYITNHFRLPLWSVRSDDMFRLMHDLRSWSQTYSCYPFGSHHHLATQQQITEKDIIEFIQLHHHMNIEISPIRATIEDCFMDLMQSNSSKSIL